MTCGLRQAGIEVVAGVDFDPSVGETYEVNNPGSTFIHADIRRLRSNYFERKLNIHRNDDCLIMVGCSPCQFYSIINTDHSKAEKSKNLLGSFARFVDYYRPGYVLVENVPGIITNQESILPTFLKKLYQMGYDNCVYKVVDMSHYGVPQSRKRFSLIASRLSKEVSLPVPDDHVSVLAEFLGETNGFPRIEAGHKDNTAFNHTVAGLSEKCLQRLRLTPHDGGNRLSWAHIPELQLKCYVGKDDCFNDNYGRMWWNRPAPTITTRFYGVSNGRFAHPDEDRAISIREGATLQTFPKEYVFRSDSMTGVARMIGNAVPCEYARRLGEKIIKLAGYGTI